MAVKGDQRTVRALNRRLLLRLLREQCPISRTALAERSGLSNGAVTRIVGELMTEGLLVERAVGVSTGGRPPVLLDLDASARVVAGLKLMDDAILAVLVDLKGSVVADVRVPLRARSTDKVLTRAAAAVASLMEAAGLDVGRLGGVGLCMAGAIDRQRGVCRTSPYLGWRDVPVADLLAEKVGVPVSVDNDVNALAVAESLFGRGRRARDFAVVTVGRGVGAGLVYDGTVYRGSRGGAGEFGHMVSQVGGRRCECGKDGCLEAYVGEAALMRRVHELGEDYRDLDVPTFLDRARHGDRLAAPVYAELTERLGAAIASLANLLNPELVLLGGEAAYLSDRFLADVRAHVDRNTFGGPRAAVELELDDWRTDPIAWARGAASLAMEHVFDPLMPRHGAAIA